MVSISILYCDHFADQGKRFQESLDKFPEEVRPLEILLQKVHTDEETIEALTRDPNRDFVVIHLSGGYGRADSFSLADRCRRLTEATLIGESTIVSIGYDEILQHFDEAVRPMNIALWAYINRKEIQGIFELFEKRGYLNQPRP